MRHLSHGLLILALVAAGPGATAAGSWVAGEGAREPSTTYDTASFMWQDPNDGNHPGGRGDRIYFNGFLIHYPGTSTRLEDGAIATNFVRFAGYLGFWRDCNGDSYIGSRAVAGMPSSSVGHWSTGTYPADAAADQLDTALCPPSTVYNRGAFIDEFRWIGPDATRDANREPRHPCADGTLPAVVEGCLRFTADEGDVTDVDARVWADFAPPVAHARPPTPAGPASAFDDSSSTLRFIDAVTGAKSVLEDEREVRFFGIRIHNGSVLAPGTWDATPNVGACGDEPRFLGGPPVVNGLPVGSCGLYPLWQARRLVNDSVTNEEDARPLVRVYDTEDDHDDSGSACDDTRFFGLAMADLQPGVHEDPLMHGSVGGTLFHDVHRGTGGGTFSGQCGRSAPPHVGDERGVPDAKTSVDVELTFHADSRYRGLAFMGLGDVPVDGFGLIGGPSAALGYERLPGGKSLPLTGGPRWISPRGYVLVDTPPGFVDPLFITQYADVGRDTFMNGDARWSALPAGVQDAHEYGRVACNGHYTDTPENREGNELNWVCSTDAWYEKWLEGPPDAPRIFVGDRFDLRDVDCYDFSPGAGVRDDDVDTPTPPERTLHESCAAWT